MAQHKSAIKAARQSVKHNARNTAARAKYRTVIKSLRTAMVSKLGTKEEARKKINPLLSEVQKVLMKAASKNLIKKRTASRQISRLNKAVDRVLGAAS